MKKTVGRGMKRYVSIDEATGEITPLEQPYAVMSLNPAIGKMWITGKHTVLRPGEFNGYATDIYANDKDSISIRGKRMKPAKYYDQLYDLINPQHMEDIRQKRIMENEGTTERELRARAEIAHARTNAYKGQL